MEIVAVRSIDSEARADTRDLAQALGNQHESIMSLLTDYTSEFEALGILRFEIGEISGRGRPPRFALLNEDQCYLLLTMVRNSELVVPLKRQLVQAFGEARRNPLTPAQQALMAAQALVNLEERQRALEERLDNTPISQFPEQEGTVQALCQELGRFMPGGWPAAYRALKARFGHGGVPLARYNSLPTRRFDEACAYLRALIGEHGRGRLLGGES